MRVLAISAALALTLAACAPNPSDALAERETAFAQALTAKDTDAVLAFYDDDAFLQPGDEGLEVIIGIREGYEALAADERGAFSIAPPTRLEASSQLAYAFGICNVTRSAEGGAVQTEGTCTRVWQLKDGVWKIVLDVRSPGIAWDAD